MQKDYWNIAKRNFRILGVISAVFFLFLVLALASAPAITSAFVAVAAYTAVVLLISVLLFVIASMFKNRNSKAIVVSYWYLGIVTTLDLFGDLFSLPNIRSVESILSKVIVYLVLIYLFDNVYKASKQMPQPAVQVSNPPVMATSVTPAAPANPAPAVPENPTNPTTQA